MNSKKEVEQENKPKAKKLIAKRDHTIVQNNERYEIKKGEEVKIPKKFLEVLKTENVI